ncbi:HK97 family phage prohead protease [Paracoccus sp. KR1-242]|uniref:HK97 family phage prohead protease n=1 Tax=Paracoccus sp. KR1-242 TaxID=3410028 RepID=UPI003C10C8C9
MDGFPIYAGGLELRDAGDGSRRLTGKFPYNSRAVINSGGNGRKPRKEAFAPRAFGFAVDDPDRDIHLLVGHSFDRPLASKKAGTFLLNDTDEALNFEAVILPEIQEATWWTDFLAQFTAGLVGGISPGFRVAPPEAVKKAEETTEEDPSEGNALIRTIFEAILFELSLVTRPAYTETSLDLRQLDSGLIVPKKSAHYRWRA